MKAKRQPANRPTESKNHSGFFLQRAAFPQRDALNTDLEAAWEEHARVSKCGGAEWERAGPFNIAGRVTSLAIHPKSWTSIFAGTAAGGVWRSNDRGRRWEPCSFPQNASSNIGALAIDPNNRECLIAATGEANLAADTYPGTGFYLSRDRGRTWTDYFVTPEGKPLSKEARIGMPRRVGTIAFDPDPSSRLLGAVGSIALDDRMPAGLYLLHKAKGLIPAPTLPMRTYNCYSVAFHPSEPGVIFAGLELRGALNGIWRSTDSGSNWTQIKRGLPTGEQFGRITLAFSTDGVLYALAANRRRRLLGIFRCRDMATWEPIADPNDIRFSDERFMHYNNTIVVHPENPDFVIWGGVSLYRTKDGGRTWAPIVRHFRAAANPSNYVHEDNHALVMPHGDIVYSGNDGGVALSLDGGDNWEERVAGMDTAMFYDVDVAPQAGRSHIFGGGAQDAGTLITGVDKLKKGEFLQAFRGDGGWLVFNDEDARHDAFGSIQNLELMRHRRGQSFASWEPVEPEEIPPPERAQRAIAVLALGPGPKRGVNSLWAGTHRLWRSDDEAKTWRPLPDVERPFDGSVISAIEISTLDPMLMFVGTTNGGIFRSRDGGETWSEDLAGIDMPRRMVSRIETHPQDPGVVAVAVASPGQPGALLTRTEEVRAHSRVRTDPPFQKTWSNIFWSENLGDTWDDVDQGLLPNVVFYALAFETKPPYHLFAAGDAGVFVKLDFKPSERNVFPGFRQALRHQPMAWLSITANLPNVVVSDLVYHQDGILTAATYGRGIWRLRVDRLNTGDQE